MLDALEGLGWMDRHGIVWDVLSADEQGAVAAAFFETIDHAHADVRRDTMMGLARLIKTPLFDLAWALLPDAEKRRISAAIGSAAETRAAFAWYAREVRDELARKNSGR